ncbi:beta-glucosidase 18-like [Andrographis paniculata]|uniref:beta-glucosidase 18-like n=1 Tax=Andrographis paniculata TaxID=175694 RepID=UPI0021E794BA|nr:beta-glucosidase 18-like [Andrographis paniculata]WPW59847.1 glycoside hydrolase [Andrographis paniculata]
MNMMQLSSLCTQDTLVAERRGGGREYIYLHDLVPPIIPTLKCSVEGEEEVVVDVRRSDFPKGFLFGAATSAYQIEGAFLEDGKSLCNWDVFCRIEGAVADGTTGDVADDHYHRYLEDIEIMHSLGLTAYRFSISWSRVVPRGTFGEVNQVGIQFYNKIIDNLLLRGIEPFVTIHHHDYPQELEDRFGAWLSPLMQEEFVHFAEICFKNFADRVKYWMTINEPNIFAEMAYERGTYPPARCSPPFGNCVIGNSDVEPLIAMHNMLLAHAKAAKVYRDQFKSKLDGFISITVCALMYVPLTDDEKDKEAAARALAFNSAWALDPLVFGDYPPEMKQYHGSELPRFSPEEKLLLKDSIDFIGVNHYGTLYAKDCIYSDCSCSESSCLGGSNRPIRGFVYTTGERDGVLIGDKTGMPRFFVVPRGMEDIIRYLRERYNNKPMYITENGYATPVDELDYRHDVKRIHFHQSHLEYLARAMRYDRFLQKHTECRVISCMERICRDGADVRGYFIWSLLDNFEWDSGYTMKFGIHDIDRSSENASMKRIPKLSALWYRDFLCNGSSVGAENWDKCVSTVSVQSY